MAFVSNNSIQVSIRWPYHAHTIKNIPIQSEQINYNLIALTYDSLV